MDLYHKSIVVTTKTLNPELVPCVTECNPLLNHVVLCSGPCFRACPVVCKTLGVPQPLPPLFPLFSPPLPPPPPPQQSLVGPPPFVLEDKNNQKGMITTSVIVMACIIGVALVFGIIFTILGIHIRRRNSRRSTREEPGFIEDFDQGQGPLQQIDNPIWYIRTVGLQRSVIDSISMIRYKKGEGLIEGTDCSVCLSGFQEDESVRLLPKCSHAFHVECIDTWLSSHKNCPLCRAPIVRSSFDGRVGLVVSTMSGSSSSDEERRLPSSEDSTSGRLMSNSVVEDGSSEDVNGNEDASTQIEQDVDVGCPGTSIEDSTLRSHSGVKTESVKNVQTEMQTIRRSASLDSSSALSIYDAVANGFPQLTNWKVKNMIKRGSSGSSSFNKELRRSSMVHSLVTKRSLSSSWRMSTFKRSRSQESILPF